MFRRFGRGEHAAALELHQRYVPLVDLLFNELNPIPCKAALHMMGQLDNVLRLPLVPMSQPGQARLRLEAYSAGALP